MVTFSCHKLISHPHFGHDCRPRLAGSKRLKSLAPSYTALAASKLEGPKQAVIIVDHGSRKPESNKQLEEFVALYRESHKADMAVAAHMEIAEPSIKDAVAQCAQAGVRHIVIAPYFLSQGRHIQQDIPALVAEAQSEHPDVQCIIADPIGIDKTVADVVHRRVSQALSKVAAQLSS